MMMKTKTKMEKIILKKPVIKEMNTEPPMTIQINPMIRAEKVFKPFKSRKGNPVSSYWTIPLKNALIVDNAVANSKIPGKKRDFFVIIWLVKKKKKERKRMASVKQSWEIEKNVKIF